MDALECFFSSFSVWVCCSFRLIFLSYRRGWGSSRMKRKLPGSPKCGNMPRKERIADCRRIWDACLGYHGHGNNTTVMSPMLKRKHGRDFVRYLKGPLLSRGTCAKRIVRLQELSDEHDKNKSVVEMTRRLRVLRVSPNA